MTQIVLPTTDADIKPAFHGQRVCMMCSPVVYLPHVISGKAVSVAAYRGHSKGPTEAMREMKLADAINAHAHIAPTDLVPRLVSKKFLLRGQATYMVERRSEILRYMLEHQHAPIPRMTLPSPNETTLRTDAKHLTKAGLIEAYRAYSPAVFRQVLHVRLTADGMTAAQRITDLAQEQAS